MESGNRRVWIGVFVLIGVELLAIEKSQKVWIFFRDKGLSSSNSHEWVLSGNAGWLSPRAIARRQRIFGKASVWDDQDAPLCPDYLQALSSMGITPIVRSRWLNAVSARVDSRQLNDIRHVPWVREVRPVAILGCPTPVSTSPPPFYREGRGAYGLDYGPSFQQNALMRVPEVHDLGLSGRGIRIGLIDTGFDYTGREVFARLRVVDEYDFIWDDPVTANQDPDPADQHNHGTLVLSVVGGYVPGMLIGPAYGAEFVLAKTEWIASETRIEEDHWVAGIEWLEAVGCDIVSSSLGYNTFDDGFSYTYADLDGRHCVTTLAADIAASKGVVVLNAAGNERNTSWYYILSPADGFHVLAIGAVFPDGMITPFSSAGPTSDGRIKPDLVAMGSGVVAVSASRTSKSGYTFVSGTSFATPLVAGVCALLLEAHPDLTPTAVREALRSTADRADHPDTLYGWGLVDAYEAIFYYGPFLKQVRVITDLMKHRRRILLDVMTKTDLPLDRLVLYYRSDSLAPFDSIQAVRMSSFRPFRYEAEIPTLRVDADHLEFYLRCIDPSSSKAYRLPANPLKTYAIPDTLNPSLPIEPGHGLTIRSIYPNPLSSGKAATILCLFQEETKGRLSVYDIRGRKIREIYQGYFPPGEIFLTWDGTDDQGNPLASGVYLIHLETRKATHTTKLIMIR